MVATCPQARRVPLAVERPVSVDKVLGHEHSVTVGRVSPYVNSPAKKTLQTIANHASHETTRQATPPYSRAQAHATARTTNLRETVQRQGPQQTRPICALQKGSVPTTAKKVLQCIITAHISLTIRRRYSTIGPPAMGVELGIVMTLVHTSHLQHILIQEVLHPFLHPEAHSNR